jgi:Heterokaryon incompatibility protein (HET)
MSHTLLTEAGLYSSLPLNGDKIRVLDVYPRGSGDSAKLAGRIRVVSLSKKPKFVALSYCWDTEHAGFTREIQIESDHGMLMLRISETAYEGVSDVRDHLGSMTIWIDAICINQGCWPEKESQIRLMKEIYSQANAVFIHLGLATEATDNALDWMARVSHRRLRGIGILGPGSWSGPKHCLPLLVARDCWTGKLNGILTDGLLRVP